MVQKNNSKGRTILITRFSAIGDIAMTIPVLYSLCKDYPEHRFVFVSRERFGQFFIGKPQNMDFIGINLKEYSGPAGLFRLYRLLKKHSPNAFADLHDVLRTKILRLYFRIFSGTKCAHIDKGRKDKKALTRKEDKCSAQLMSTFERYRKVFTQLGLEFSIEFSSVFGDKKGDIDEFNDIVPAKGNDKWVGIAPFAKHRGKIYPLDHMEQVVKEITSKSGIKVFFFGNGPEEKAVIDSWCSKYPNTVSFIGRSDFNGELRLISHLDTMVCMDSANMHMASLAGTPAISIWGATSPLAGFLGWNQKREDCIELPFICRPCSIFGNKPCHYGDYRCMNIPPKDVAARIIRKTGLQE